MKRNIFANGFLKSVALLLTLLTVLLCLASCGGEDDATEKKGYTITSEGFSFTTDDLMSGVLEGLGSMYEYSESSACPPFEGVERLYDFIHVQVTTYSSDTGDRVMSVIIKDDAAEVAGITIGSTVEEMKNALGEKYSEPYAGTYVYTAENGSLLKCLVRDGEILSINVVTAKAN